MIFIAGDHHGESVLSSIRFYLESKNIEFIEYGFSSGKDPDAKLEIFIPQVVEKIRNSDDASGILVCGTGAGVEIGANRFSGIRASLCYSPKSVEWARVYDKANILCLAGWAEDDLDVNSIMDSWFQSKYDGSIKRLKMFEVFDSWAKGK